MYCPSPSGASMRDHPREYGENNAFAYLRGRRYGSSPRIRGKFKQLPHNETSMGIIPANTGKIASGIQRPDSGRDHPREYGENEYTVPAPLNGFGSSPRIRGKSEVGLLRGRFYGIIPANTGKIPVGVEPSEGVWDHPREYGENLQG